MSQVTRGFDRSANVLGAVALFLGDRMRDAVVTASGLSESAATVLSAVYNFLDAPSIDLLSSVLDLSSSGTVRLVDGLESEGLVSRARGADARVTVVSLTSKGRRRAEKVVEARARVLADALAPLTAAERASFEQLSARMLHGLRREPGARGWMCRLCSTATCGAARGEPCPVVHGSVR